MAEEVARPEPPPAACGRFERVVVLADRPGEGLVGRIGTVIWRDRPCYNRRLAKWGEWAYCVHFAPDGRYRAFRESAVRPTGAFDPEGAHRGRGFEISFDADFDGPMETIEGAYRLPGEHWRAFVFEKGDVGAPVHEIVAFDSGVGGVAWVVPRGEVLDAEYVHRAMLGLFGAGRWEVVRGPDSMMLK